MIQGDPQRAACLSAQIDELLFHVGTREAFRRAIGLQNELNALRPPPPRAPDPDAPISTTYDWLSKRSFQSYVRIAIRQDKDGLYRTDTDFQCKGGVEHCLATPKATRRPRGRERRRSETCSNS